MNDGLDSWRDDREYDLDAESWMSRKGFAAFSIVTPILLSVFLIYIGRTAPESTGMPMAMEKFAAGFTVFFAFLSWCIVRSNKKSPPKIDYPSLLVSVAVLMVFMALTIGRLPKSSHASSAASSSRN